MNALIDYNMYTTGNGIPINTGKWMTFIKIIIKLWCNVCQSSDYGNIIRFLDTTVICWDIAFIKANIDMSYNEPTKTSHMLPLNQWAIRCLLSSILEKNAVEMGQESRHHNTMFYRHCKETQWPGDAIWCHVSVSNRHPETYLTKYFETLSLTHLRLSDAYMH